MPEHCPNCNTSLIGEYCHTCGQRRIGGPITVQAFIGEVLRRVFRLDRAVITTFSAMLRSPGALVADYLEGRRSGLLDPLHYFISSIFVQLVIAGATRAIAPLIERESALSWLQHVGGVVTVKVLFVFWMAGVWRLLFRRIRYSLGEICVFATYVFATTGLLWAVVPIVDLIVPVSLGANPIVVSFVTILIELGYTSFAVWQFSRLPWWNATLRVGVVLAVGYGVIVALIGLERAVMLLLPPMPA